MDRRQFIYSLFSSMVLSQLNPTFASSAINPSKTLILIELKGGNDGLNTLVPFNDPLYSKLRPNLGLKQNEIIQLKPELFLHKSLSPWKQLWLDQDLAIVQGLGYKNPIRSHFRSIDIWDTASDSDEYLNHGWLNDCLAMKRSTYDFEGLILGSSDPGPLQGGDINSLVIKNQKQFLRTAKRVKQSKHQANNPSLMHFESIKQDIQSSYEMIQKKLDPSIQVDGFQKDKLSRALKSAAQYILSGVNVPVIKVTLGGFDTHSNQKNTHANLLRQLGNATSNFARIMKKHNLWDQVVLATYSEFGRRAQENGSKGSDHGTANTHFVMGGQVKGGLFGEAAKLDNLVNNDLQYTQDFRSYVKTLVENTLKTDAPQRLKNFEKMAFL
ncbi:MAG: DUF1501 domain-containing protein [Candidatus Cloacimonetes bacterium]|nr:DUF1501 domain-containing protein [Candidatus Cloacimonadota bacterium]